jgi:hypothetical protein
MDLELPPAERAGPMLDEPAVDAGHVEHVPAVRQASSLLPDLEVLQSGQVQQNHVSVAGKMTGQCVSLRNGRRTWRQTEQPERSPTASRLYSSVMVISGSLSMDARGMPLVPSTSNRSGDSLKGDELTAFICDHNNRQVLQN